MMAACAGPTEPPQPGASASAIGKTTPSSSAPAGKARGLPAVLTSPSATPESSPAALSRLLSQIDDPSGDAGSSTPGYGDMVRVAIIDQGGARIEVTLAGPIPARLGTDETMGLGVDLYEGTKSESSHQIFAEGSDEGWFAYLDSPEGGAVTLPGRFAIERVRIVFEVEWRNLSRSLSRFGAFTDWSAPATLITKVGEDHAPDSGTASLEGRTPAP